MSALQSRLNRPTVLLFHTTCCYFHDTLRLNARLEAQLPDQSISFLHLLTSGDSCTYFYQLRPQTKAQCSSVRSRALEWLLGKSASVHCLEEFYSIDEDPITAPLDIQALVSTEFRGLNMWAVIKASLAALHQWHDVDGCLRSASASEWSATLELLRAACKALLAIDEFLARYAPTHCLLFNGLFFLERIMLERCRKRGIQVIATESSTFADRKHFSLSGAVGNRNDLRGIGTDVSYARRLLPIEKRHLDSFFSAKLSGQNSVIAQGHSHISSKGDLGIPRDMPVVLFLGQVPHDSVMVSDANAFPQQAVVIETLIELFSNSLAFSHLIVRLHPGGEITSMRDDVLARMFPETRPRSNVTVFRGLDCNTYDLMRLADVAITSTSQAGLEFLWLKKPLITLGAAYYAGHGFTLDVQHPEGLEPALRRALTDEFMTPETKCRIDVFLHYLVFEYLVPIDRESGAVTEAGVSMIANLIYGRHRLHGISEA
jgi:hypothetical protein